MLAARSREVGTPHGHDEACRIAGFLVRVEFRGNWDEPAAEVGFELVRELVGGGVPEGRREGRFELVDVLPDEAFSGAG